MTAVEWLIQQILEIPLDDTTNAAHLKQHVCKVTVFEKAIEMEKEQIEKAKEEGYNFAMSEATKEIHKNYKPL